MVHLAVIADDLTGAADAAASFAAAGLVTSVVFDGSVPPDVDVVVLSTESRDRDADTAIARVTQATRSLLENPGRRPTLLYKKIDSALRGHPCDELMAAMSASGRHRAVLAPALPAQGRTTVDGRHLIDGCPLHETELGREAGTCNLAEVFSCAEELPVHLIDHRVVRTGAAQITALLAEDTPGIWIFDAQTEQDLTAIACGAVEAGVTLLAGSAGLASQLVPILAARRTQEHPPVCPGVEGPILVVAGSRHAATLAQVAVLERAGVPVIRPSRNVILTGDASIASTVEELSAALAHNGTAALTTAGMAVATHDAASVARTLARVTAEACDRQPPGALVLTGGDVAAAVLDQLGARSMALGGEIAAAIPWGILDSKALSAIPIVTKAGSFGDASTFVECIRFLRA